MTSAVVVTAVLVFVTGGCAAAMHRDEPHRKVLFVGMDGLEWDILNPLLEQGKLPNLGRLISEGTSGYLLSEDPTTSPVIWTILATGKPREENGITSFYKDGFGESGRTPFTSADRKVPALWNIAGMMGRTVGCFGWWCTYPAEQVNGVMVSSFVTYDSWAYANRGLQAGTGADKLTYPKEIAAEMMPLVRKASTVDRLEIARFVGIDNYDHPMFTKPEVGASVGRVLPWTYATDVSFVQIAEHYIAKDQYDLSMVYIQGTDTMCHRFWAFREKSDMLHKRLEQYNLLPEEEQTYRRFFADTIDNYYIFADELLGRILAVVDQNTAVVVCSDHGFGPFVDTGEELWGGHVFSGSHRLLGTVILWGPGIRKGVRLDDTPTIFDITPTILALMGLPLAKDMPGQPIVEAFDAGFLQDYRPAFVATYDVNYTAGEVPESIPITDEYLERLRSLGYIQ